MDNRGNRAKQFLPFDALKGFQEALREKEREFEEKRELSEESLKVLDEELNRIEIGSRVKIKYYKNRKYVNIDGIVTNVNTIKKKIKIDEENINLGDIIEIKVI